jgi:hypothetical protein
MSSLCARLIPAASIILHSHPNPTDGVEVYINNLTELTVELNMLHVSGGHVCRFASTMVSAEIKLYRASSVPAGEINSTGPVFGRTSHQCG